MSRIELHARVKRPRRRNRHGQAFIELALVAPVLLFLIFAGLDVGTNFVASVSVDEAAHAGLLAAVQQKANTDLGAVIRSASSDLYQKTWGATAVCKAGTGSACGDPGGCQYPDAYWSSISNNGACFAVGTCTLATTGCLMPPGITWSSSPGPPTGLSYPSNRTILVIRVVLCEAPISPLTGPWLPSSGPCAPGLFSIQDDAAGVPA